MIFGSIELYNIDTHANVICRKISKTIGSLWKEVTKRKTLFVFSFFLIPKIKNIPQSYVQFIYCLLHNLKFKDSKHCYDITDSFNSTFYKLKLVADLFPIKGRSDFLAWQWQLAVKFNIRETDFCAKISQY